MYDWLLPQLAKYSASLPFQHSLHGTNRVQHIPGICTRGGFSRMDQSRLATLIQILLTIAGIERNPGTSPRWPCGVCKKSAANGIIQCLISRDWHHMRCVAQHSADVGVPTMRTEMAMRNVQQECCPFKHQLRKVFFLEPLELRRVRK